MTDETVTDLIRYDILTQEAMRSVVKKVITEAAKAGLPGDHHFFVSFLTGFPGVQLSNRMRERYPEEMTIVIQHQFWDLKTNDTGFEIGLSFDEIPETLSIPFAAIKGFFDPSVQFGLQFDVDDDEDDEQEEADIASIGLVNDENTVLSANNEPERSDPVVIAQKPEKPVKAKKAPKKKSVQASAPVGETESGGAEVVSLDAFRKKT